jgi:hypothetical protein
MLIRGTRLALKAAHHATLASAGDRQCTEVFSDTDYDDDIYGLTFALDGRLATASIDGKVRLYDRELKLVVPRGKATGGVPFRITFSPDGTTLAVGYENAATVDLFDGHSLAPLPRPAMRQRAHYEMERLAPRQAHCEHRPLARLARHRHVATRHARELAGDGEAEPGAAEALRGGGISLAELLEQFRLLFRGQTYAGVGDGELDETAAIVRLARTEVRETRLAPVGLFLCLAG